LIVLSDFPEDTIEVWTCLENSMKKYVEQNLLKIVPLTIASLKKIFGETPTETQVRLMAT